MLQLYTVSFELVSPFHAHVVAAISLQHIVNDVLSIVAAIL